ncbi:MAG: carboxypeptidase regulatory-like domain-containing protein [Gemmatimonadetes bacterium]|nr:carboxypeptidase regulatory-like domain-containing protein [Gemmatimonadota bacterium]
MFRRHRGLLEAGVVVAFCTVVSSVALAQRPHTIHGVVRDSVSSRPLAGAQVYVRSASLQLSARTDEDGTFRFTGLISGRYSYSVLRIGFSEYFGAVELADRDRDIAVEIGMRPIAQLLDVFRVRGDVSAIYGMVGKLPDLGPLAGATVQVLGGSEPFTTDSSGGFFVSVRAPGSYLVRITHDGHVDRLFNVEIPRGRAIEASQLLDPGEPSARGLDAVYQDLAQRLRYRGMNSALVSGAEIRQAGSNVVDGMQGSRSLGIRGLRFGPNVCLFVNGVPRPGATVEAYRVEEIEAVEAYARGGDRSNALSQAWPAGAPCGQLFRSFTRGVRTGNVIQYVVIWLRK